MCVCVTYTPLPKKTVTLMQFEIAVDTKMKAHVKAPNTVTHPPQVGRELITEINALTSNYLPPGAAANLSWPQPT